MAMARTAARRENPLAVVSLLWRYIYKVTQITERDLLWAAATLSLSIPMLVGMVLLSVLGCEMSSSLAPATPVATASASTGVTNISSARLHRIINYI